MLSTKKYAGVVIPAVTPLTENFQLDEAAVEKMFANFYKNKVSPFVLGTTGESASIPNSAKQAYIKAAVKNKQAGTTLYAGISSNIFEESVVFAKDCFDAGIDVVAATLPTYYVLSESQMKKYFEQLADAVNGPLIIYNIPATTHMSIPLSVIDELSHHPNLVGTKDSERSDDRLSQSIELWKSREDFSHFLGWAARSAKALIDGSDGLIPSTGNVYPKLYDDMINAVASNDDDEAYRLQKLSDDLGNVYQGGKLLGESLWALKVLMQQANLCQPYVMPPLQPQSSEDQKTILDNLHSLLQKEGITL